MEKVGLRTQDWVVMAMLAAASAVAYTLLAHVWTVLTASMGPLGGMLLGLFQFGHLVAFAVLRKSRVTTITSVLTTVGQLLLGDPSGAYVLGWGVIHGLGAELVFMTFGYKRVGFFVLALAAGVAACLGQLYTYYVYGWEDSTMLFFVSLPILFVSSAVESGGIAYLVSRAVARAIPA